MKIAVVGLKIGRIHADVCAALDEYELEALCDLDKQIVNRAAGRLAVSRVYTDYQKMLDEVKLDAIVIATPTGLHEEMIRQAAAAGIRNIYCEKPIASNAREVCKIKELCGKEHIRMVIGHQRRVSEPYRTMRKLVEENKIGRICRIRATCPGDLLTDGTHLIDSALYILGDPEPEWVLGQIYRGRKATEQELQENPFAYHGVRYGHFVEEGCIAIIGMPGDVRVELICGTAHQEKEGYQHIEVVGDCGYLLRSSDGASPAVLAYCDGKFTSINCNESDMGFEEAHRLSEKYFSGAIDEHPMEFSNACRGYTIMNAVFESARLNARLELPCAMNDDPLRKMIEEGRIE